MLSLPFVDEASGICRSILYADKDAYYVHNDSGSKPYLRAFASQGKSLGWSVIPSRRSTVDAEDCSSAVVRGMNLLMISDVGDNTCSRGAYHMYLMEEPSVTTGDYAVQTAFSVTWMYPDGNRRNCEATALLQSGVMLVVTKSYPAKSGPTSLYEIRSVVSGDTDKPIVTFVKTLPSSYGIITGMDVMGDKLVLLGIINGKSVGTVLALEDYALVGSQKLPSARQNEGICFSHDGTSLITVSEVDRKIQTTVLPLALRPAM